MKIKNLLKKNYIKKKNIKIFEDDITNIQSLEQKWSVRK